MCIRFKKILSDFKRYSYLFKDRVINIYQDVLYFNSNMFFTIQFTRYFLNMAKAQLRRINTG